MKKHKRNDQHWFQTFSGLRFYPTNPKPSEVRIEDIAHAGSLICRWGGHAKRHYSVNQHQIHVSQQLFNYYPDDFLLQMHGLLHDATESYIGDMVRPLKVQMPMFNEIEENLMKVILKGLKVPKLNKEQTKLLKRADNELLLAERRDLLVPTGVKWNFTEQPAAMQISPWITNYVYTEYLKRYHHLKGELKR